MAKYQNLLVAIAPDRDDRPALRRAVYLVRHNGGRIKAFLTIYDFSYEMTTLLSPEERAAMQQGVIRQECRFYLDESVPIEIKVVWHNCPFAAIIQEVLSGSHDLLLKMAHQHDRFESAIFTPLTGIYCASVLAQYGWAKIGPGQKAAKLWWQSICQ